MASRPSPATCDEDQVRRALSGAEAVVDLVGIGRERGQSFGAVHVDGAAGVARLAAAAGAARLLHVSALGVAEDAPSAADRTKAAGERAVRAAFPSATIVRPNPCNYPHFSTPSQCLAGFVQIVSLCAELFEGSPRQATLSGSNIDRSRNYNGPCGWSEMWVIARPEPGLRPRRPLLRPLRRRGAGLP